MNPTIFLGSIELREPVTALTDFCIAIISAYAVWYFHQNRQKASESFKFYQRYFLFFAIAMTSAAWLGHGFQAYLSPKWKIVGWMFSLTAQLFLARASLLEIKDFISRKTTETINALLYIQYAIFMVMILFPATSDFKIPQIGSALVLSFFVLPMQAIHFMRSKNIGSLIIVISIVYGLIPSYVYNNQLSVNRWFNYHDISHLLVCMFMIMMIFGTRKLAFISSKE